MANKIPALGELFPYYKRVDLMEKVVAQLRKDFGWFKLEFHFKEESEETPYRQLFFKILPLIDDMLNEDYFKLLSLLYRIDIEEEHLKRRLNEFQSADTAEVIADFILKRELQKVIIRENYGAT